MLLDTLGPLQKLLTETWSSSSSSFEHWTNATKNGSLQKLSLELFLRFPIFGKLTLLEVGGVAWGGSGRTFNVESFFLWLCFLGIPGWLCFLGIPGKRSQENGTPEYRSGVAGLGGESSAKYEDEQDEKDDDELKEGVRRPEVCLVARNVVSLSFVTFWARSLGGAEESITFEAERRDTLSC